MAAKAGGGKNMKRGGNKHGTKKSGGGGGMSKGSIGSGGNKKPNLKKKSKLVVTFDPEKRKEYLTGFHKRKQERRRFGLDMEAFKQQKKLLEARKQRREEQKAKLAEMNLLEPPADAEEKKIESDDEDEEDEVAMTKVMRFDDEHTQNKFGDVVTVTTSIGDLKSDESEDEVSDEEYDISEDEDEEGGSGAVKSGDAHSKYKEKQLSLFQRIQLKRRGMALPSKRAKLKDARANRKATLGRKGHKAKAPARGKDKDSVEVVAKPKKGAFGKGKFSKR